MTAARRRDVLRILATALGVAVTLAVAIPLVDDNLLLLIGILLVTGFLLGLRNAHPLGIPIGGALAGVLSELAWLATHDTSTSGDLGNAFVFAMELELVLSLVITIPGYLLGRAFIKATVPPWIFLVDEGAAPLSSSQGSGPAAPSAEAGPSVLPKSNGAQAVLLAGTAIGILVAVFGLVIWSLGDFFRDYAG
jgi:hypothetical protein